MTSNMYGYSNNHYGQGQAGEISSSQLIILDNECQDCGKQFTNVSNLNRHVRKIHKREPNPLPQPVARLTVNCPVCTHQFCTRKELDGHLQFDHDISVSLIRVEFDTMDEFGAWKRGIERETVSYYAVERTVVNVKSKKTMYGCHRSGTFTSQRKRDRTSTSTSASAGTIANTNTTPDGSSAARSKGSIKMGAVCPSRMAVHQTPDKIYVDFVSTHVGHERDPVATGRKKNAAATTHRASESNSEIANASTDLDNTTNNNNVLQVTATTGCDATALGVKRVRRPRNRTGGASSTTSRPKVNKALLTKRRGDVIAKLSSLITFVRDCTSHAQLDVILRHLEPVKPALEAMESSKVATLAPPPPPMVPTTNQHVSSVGPASMVGGYGVPCSNQAMFAQPHQQQHHHQPHQQQQATLS